MTIAREEIFGPVARRCCRFDDVDDAIAKANDTIYGLRRRASGRGTSARRTASRERSAPGRSGSTPTTSTIPRCRSAASSRAASAASSGVEALDAYLETKTRLDETLGRVSEAPSSSDRARRSGGPVDRRRASARAGTRARRARARPRGRAQPSRPLGAQGRPGARVPAADRPGLRRRRHGRRVRLGTCRLAVGRRGRRGPGVSCGRCAALPRARERALPQLRDPRRDARRRLRRSYVVVPAVNLFPKPSGSTCPQAAAVPLTCS